ncbi:MAG: fumarate hydratase [Hyperthermus sp.]|nr:MAG: fumarate hydratase [Hyperthermus sp.]
MGVDGGYDRLVGFLVELVRVAVTRLPLDVYEALRRAVEVEDNPLARSHLEAMIANAELAARTGRPICQDTGTPYFYIRVGADYPLRSRLAGALRDALRRATRLVPLRPNAVDPFSGVNSGDNVGRHVPWVSVEIVEGSMLEATFVPKGGGSEAPTRLVMANPLEAERALYEAVLASVVDAGAKPCPPVVIGVGVGPGGDVALALAKRAALLRPLGTRNPDPRLARLESRLLEYVNSLGIGPQGFGGRTTALGLHIEYAHRHPATYAIGVVFSCWALRRATGVIDEAGEWRITSRHI